ncbi:MAG: fumarylacetoacetate hydrolase family protein [Candidatus Eisenbacteria bacterium]|uniref:Fumarylacetoacetate hydrolase family protein n=1 Tax=Eiseniibacteriota bacterium TaxID=2212470 RepID=A0A933W3H5_UNCEI|nr:fumarylacetoacetate hydrolase family protein [Candidatus Eisenbacteria bacterium]
MLPPVNPTHPHALIARYRLDGAISYGEVSGRDLLRLTAAPWLGGVPTGERDALERVELLAPSEPTKIVCIGLNYVEHARESLTNAPGAGVPAEPLMFLKPPSSVLAPEGVVRYPAGVERLDPEGEVALVIGRRATAVRPEEALSYVAGVTAFDDVSARNWQKSDGQWARAKGHDTFAPFGPYVAWGLSPLDLALELRVNGEVRQRARSSQMHFGPAFLVSHVSRHMTLEPGDLIATGTPAGIAPLEPGDVVEVEVEGVGVLRHSIGTRES